MIEIMVAAEEIDNGVAPATYGEALRGPEGKQWQIAFDAEVKSLNDNKVYTVVVETILLQYCFFTCFM